MTLREGLGFLNMLLKAIGKPYRNATVQAALDRLIVAPTPIQLTTTEAEALIGSFAVGSQYIVTDWQPNTLLYADSASVLKPCSGSVTLMNGEELPSFIAPDTLFVHTEEMGSDEWGEYDISLIDYVGYHIKGVRIKSLSSIDVSSSYRIYDNSNTVIWAEYENLFPYALGWASIYPVVNTGGDPVGAGMMDKPPYTLHWAGYKSKWVIELALNQDPIPLLFNVYTSTDGSTAIAQFNDRMQDPSAFLSDFTLSGKRGVTSVSLDSDPTKFILTPETPFANGDVITISIVSGNIKNIWGGVLPEQINIKVTNNVPA